MTNNFQRGGSVSNSDVGRKFEELARAYFFKEEGLTLQRDFRIEIGVSSKKKGRRFDLGSNEPAVLVECKSHRWTETGNMPSAKVTVWNESMFYFLLAPSTHRKILFVLKDINPRTGETLAEYYIKHHSHLIPPGVSIIEFDEYSGSAREMKVPCLFAAR
jgi:hypothetical protein